MEGLVRRCTSLWLRNVSYCRGVSHGTPEHWSAVYATKAADEVSWYQPTPETSMRLLSAVAAPTSAVIDVGAGASTLVDVLLEAGWSDLTVLDVSATALNVVADRLGERHHDVSFIAADVLTWQPRRKYDVWHDRAMFHFLVATEDQQRYVAKVTDTVSPGGFLVLGTFAADGPTRCSGLPTARYSVDQLSEMFAPSFQLMLTEREEHVTPTGRTQPFTWVVLRRT
jgi:2-polyprenyl-3-methyl-5-hydroxy-6-metoxy-1,4-benzoquinol methylase